MNMVSSANQTARGKPFKEDERLKQVHQVQAGYLISILVGLPTDK